MKIFFTLPVLCFCLFSSAQQYRSFPSGEASWKIARCWYFFPGGWYDEHTVYQPGDDTVLYGATYKKLYITFRLVHGTVDSSYTRFLGGIREEDRKIYMVSEEFCLDTLERVVYDFNDYVVGDTIFTHTLTNMPLLEVPHVVTAVDSVLVGAAHHRRLHLSDTLGNPLEAWIEGVGSTWGLPYATYWIMTDNSYDLICFNNLGYLSYENPSPGFAFCTTPFPDIQCDTGVVPQAGCAASFDFERQNDTVLFSGRNNLVTTSNWQWYFGDDQFGSGQNIQHIYSYAGWKEVCLAVTGTDSTGANCTNEFCDSVYITDGCIDSAQICPQGSLCCDAPLYEPVCGCNGVTYDNACQAALWHGVLHYTDGVCITSTGKQMNSDLQIAAYPNPAQSKVILKLNSAHAGEAVAHIKDVFGKTVLTQAIHLQPQGEARIEFTVNEIPSGMYLLETVLNGKKEIIKLMIHR